MKAVIKIFVPGQNTIVITNPHTYTVNDKGVLVVRPDADAYSLGGEITTTLPFLISKPQ